MNKKGQAGFIIFGVIVLILIFAAIGTYNSLVKKDTEVNAQWGKVQTAYQRRADLIPNLIATVQGSANFERTTLTQITEMRSQAGKIQRSITSASSTSELQVAQNDMNNLLGRLMVIVEAYPTLQSNQNFLALQDELAGTENRIKYERDNYNNAVKDYQIATKSFPSVIFAKMFGYNSDKYNMFKADEGADKSPTVSFNFTN